MDASHDQPTFSLHNPPSKGDFGVKSDDIEDDVGTTTKLSVTPENIAVEFSREMEKKMIREEIIASNIIRRRELENEVRMELMIEERVKGASDDVIGGNVKLTSGSSYGSGIEGMQQMEMEDVALGKWPFDRDPSFVPPRVAGKFDADLSDEVMSEAMSSAGIIGVKRKAETPARASDKETSALTVSADTQKWFCSVCGVSTTSELTLNAHFQGKKHKAREARPKANDTTNTNTISMSDNTSQPVSNMSTEQENNLVTNKWECSLCQLSVTSETLLRSHIEGKKHKAKEAKLQTDEITINVDGVPSEKSQERSMSSSNENATATDKQWYCSLCGVSASSEKNLSDHLNGKKHKAKAGLPLQGTDNMNHEPTEKVSEAEVLKGKSLDKGEFPKHEPKTSDPNTELSKDDETELHAADNSSKTKSEANSNPVLGATSDISDAKRGVTEGNQQESGLGERLGTEELEKKSSVSMEFVKYWHCKLCNMGTHDEATMAAHRKSIEHMTLLKKHGGGLITVASVPKNALESGGSSRDELAN
ncbi:hypothetical protein vseg_014105 [Gypsophila vaccaria]